MLIVGFSRLMQMLATKIGDYMEEKILNCIPEAIFEELGNILAESLIDRINTIFKKRKVPYEFIEDEETLEFYPRQVDR